LALRELGTTIDLHGGGPDLIFPHHECERAQSEAATGQTFVRHWLHAPFVYKDGQKMSKSLGNLVFIDQLRKEYDPRAIRLAVLEHHYRHHWSWDDGLMPRAVARLDRWMGASGRSGNERALNDVRAALDDDLDTPAAVAAIDAAVDGGRRIDEAAALLGVSV
jgi:L-cysteine:1D-myo-inositol 2-amino-2-deoxy-alpha-D-glucopyranoside ligase